MRRDELIAIHDCPVHYGAGAGAGATARRAAAAGRPAAARLPARVRCAGDADREGAPGRAPEVFAGAARRAARHGARGLLAAPAPGGRPAAVRAAAAGSSCGASRAHATPTVCCTARRPSRRRCPSCTSPRSPRRARTCDRASGVSVLDLYCGLGASLREWTAAGSAALGVELSGEAVELAAANAPAALVLRGTCTERLPQILPWWCAQVGRARRLREPPALRARGAGDRRACHGTAAQCASRTFRAAPGRWRATCRCWKPPATA